MKLMLTIHPHQADAAYGQRGSALSWATIFWRRRERSPCRPNDVSGRRCAHTGEQTRADVFPIDCARNVRKAWSICTRCAGRPLAPRRGRREKKYCACEMQIRTDKAQGHTDTEETDGIRWGVARKTEGVRA